MLGIIVTLPWITHTGTVKLSHFLNSCSPAHCASGMQSGQDRRVHINLLKLRAVGGLPVQLFKDMVSQDEETMQLPDNAMVVSYQSSAGHLAKNCIAIGTNALRMDGEEFHSLKSITFGRSPQLAVRLAELSSHQP